MKIVAFLLWMLLLTIVIIGANAELLSWGAVVGLLLISGVPTSLWLMFGSIQATISKQDK